MLRLYGCPVTEEDGRWLVARLYQDAHGPAVSAALAIEKGLDWKLHAVALTPDERTAILGVLSDMPEGLAELRGVLLREHGSRLRSDPLPSRWAGFG